MPHKDFRKTSQGNGELVAEVFAVGRWNGYDFKLSDLQGIAESFSKFKDLLKVPIKMGHNAEQPMTDGKPALGWVEDVWVEGTKLMAKFTDMPSVVLEAIRKKLYRKVSVELEVDVEHKGAHHDFVLSAVALLGAEIPAVSTLADLDAFLASARAAFSKRERLCFEAIAGDLNKEHDMDLKELSDKVVALSAQVATLTATNATLTAQVAAFEAEKANAAKAAKAAQMSAKRAEFNGLFDEAVKQGAITPAQKTVFAKTIQLDNDDALEKLEANDIKALCGNAKFAAAQGAGSGNGQSNGDPNADTREPGVIAAERANVLIAKGLATDFAAATIQVFTADPELGRKYNAANTKGA